MPSLASASVQNKADRALGVGLFSGRFVPTWHKGEESATLEADAFLQHALGRLALHLADGRSRSETQSRAG